MLLRPRSMPVFNTTLAKNVSYLLNIFLLNRQRVLGMCRQCDTRPVVPPPRVYLPDSPQSLLRSLIPLLHSLSSRSNNYD